jgi:hypothetical protein
MFSPKLEIRTLTDYTILVILKQTELFRTVDNGVKYLKCDFLV